MVSQANGVAMSVYPAICIVAEIYMQAPESTALTTTFCPTTNDLIKFTMKKGKVFVLQTVAKYHYQTGIHVYELKNIWV